LRSIRRPCAKHRNASIRTPETLRAGQADAANLNPQSGGHSPMEAQMQYAYTLTTTIPASAQEIYDAWLDSLAHTEMTGADAVMSDEVGAEVEAWNGYITGRNLELVPGALIVQSWRTTEFTDEHEDSIIKVTLEETEDGTLLTLVHSKVPAAHKSYEQGGWEKHYFEPMKAYFGVSEEAGTDRKAKAAKPKTKTKAKAKAKAKTPAKSKTKSKTKRAAASTKPKSAAKKAKTAARSKKKAKRAVAKAKSKSAKKAKRNTAKKGRS
jgi:uncharacterized protein YndB with AHSA1/START domain